MKHNFSLLDRPWTAEQTTEYAQVSEQIRVKVPEILTDKENMERNARLDRIREKNPNYTGCDISGYSWAK